MAPFQFRPPICAPGETYAPCGDDTKESPTGADIITVTPYWAVEYDECERGSGADTYQTTVDRVTEALNVNLSWHIEKALWTGEVNSTAYPAADPNPKLADTAAFQPNGTTAVGPTKGIWDMIEYLNDTVGGVVSMIHVEQRVVPFLMFYGLAVQDGNRLRVAGTDHLFVAGTGYQGTDPSGNAPAAGESWIYATTPVEVRTESAPFIVGGTEGESIDHSTNMIEVRAEQLAIAYWDGCAHAGTALCLEEPGPDCTAGS